ncbi:MAG TPA: NIPSNAP family protein [Methylomirabilota bacterium]|nr:NIPSNAP family protein [Methylomirabilota bacterium]
MIYEIRTYQLKPGSLAEAEKRFGEAYEYRRKYSPLAAFWHTEVGPLNEIIHMWGYADLAERERIRAEAVKDPNWPPKISEFILGMQSEVVVPFPFVPEPRPGTLGPIFEMRYYTIKAGTLPDLKKRWESRIAERMKLSPVVLAGHVEIGTANAFVHIWAYASMDERLAIRAKARELGVWPPPGGADTLLTQANKIMLPASFSPVQ